MCPPLIRGPLNKCDPQGLVVWMLSLFIVNVALTMDHFDLWSQCNKTSLISCLPSSRTSLFFLAKVNSGRCVDIHVLGLVISGRPETGYCSQIKCLQLLPWTANMLAVVFVQQSLGLSNYWIITTFDFVNKHTDATAHIRPLHALAAISSVTAFITVAPCEQQVCMSVHSLERFYYLST